MDWALVWVLTEIELATAGTLDAAKARGFLASARGIGDPQVLLPTLGIVARWGRELGWPAAEVEALVDELVVLVREAQTVIGFEPYHGVVAAAGYRCKEIIEELARRRATLWTPAIEAEAQGDPVAAAEVFAEIGDRADEADARLRGAARLGEAGEAAAAAKEATLAADFYRSVGATARLVDAERILAGLGERGAAS